MDRKQLILDQTRNLGDIISDAFVFVKRNFRVIGELFLILVLPVLLVSIYNLYFVFTDLDFLDPETSQNMFFTSGLKVILGYGFSILAFLIFYYINYATAICYVENENIPPSKGQVIQFLKENVAKYLTYFFAIFLLFLAVGTMSFVLFSFLPGIGILVFFAFIFAIFYYFPMISILPMVYLDQEISFQDAVSKTIAYVRGQWWPTFGAIFVTNIIGSFASYILIIPIYAIMMIQLFSSSDPGSSSDSVGFWMSMLMIVSIIASTIILIYTSAAVALKYYDLKEKKERTSLMNRIDDIGTGHQTMFENEGDF